MTAPPLGTSTRTLLLLGALVAGFYVVAQVTQAVLFRFVLPDAPDTAAAIATRLLGADRLRQAAILLSLALIPIAYAAIAAVRWASAPGACLVGFAFGLLFATFETGYRSVDLFEGGRWAADFVAAADDARRAVILERFDVWQGAIRALYLPLLAAHALASAAFAVAVGFPRSATLDRLLTIALAANAVRAMLRIAQMHMGFDALAPLNGALYLPVTLLTYGTLAAWLAVTRSRARELG